jgi:hypothetical protein
VAFTLPLPSRKRPRPNDIIEIPTPAGLAYAQYTHKHDAPPRFGALLRVLPGIFANRPTGFSGLVQQRELFWLFFPLGAACSRGIVRVVAEEQRPLWAHRLPRFRAGTADSAGKIRVWFIWDGQEYQLVESLTEEQRAYPYLTGVWNDTLLIERIVQRWVPPTYEEQSAT